MAIVRDAEPDDAEAVAGVHVRSWRAAYRGLLPDDYLDGLRTSDRAARYSFARRPGDAETLVVVAEGAVCGFATTGPSRDPDAARAGELYALYLDPEQWGRGLGRSLIAEARARLHGQRFTVAILWVLAGNQRAQRFYRIDGWQPDGSRRQARVWDVSVDEVRYRRPLP
jgi:ribosomal protein S18 acetylase RimI-like enzyme